MSQVRAISCCSVLQCVAVWCGVVQCGSVWSSVIQCVAVCCSVLQCVAVCCSVLQCIAVCCSVLQCLQQDKSSDADATSPHHATVRCSVLRSVAVCCRKNVYGGRHVAVSHYKYPKVQMNSPICVFLSFNV